MQPAQPQPQQQAAQPSQLVPQAGWAAGATYQQQGLSPTSMPGMGFGSMPMSMMTGTGMVPGALNGMLAARMAPGVASGRVGSPRAEGLVYSLPQQDAHFHFSDGAYSAAFGGNPGFAGGPPTNDDLLAAFMPGCDEVGGGSSGSAGLFGSGGIFAGMSGPAPSTGGTAGGSSGQRPHQPLRPSPLSNGSSGGSGPNHGSGGGGGALGSGGGSTAPRPLQPPCNSVSSAMPIASLMFPAGSMQSEGSLPLGPMLRSPPPQQASLASFQMMQQAATVEQQEQTSQRRPQDGALPLTAQQVQAQHDMQRFLNAEPGQPQQLGTGSGLSGPANTAATAAPQKPQSAFTEYCPPSAPQTPGQVPSQAQPQQMGGVQMGMAQQPSWPMTPQQQWAASQWAASQQQQMMAGGQAPGGAAFGQHVAVPQQPQGQQQPGFGQATVPGGQVPAAGFGQQLPQQAAGQPQGSGQPVSGSQQPAVSGQAAPLQQPQQLPPEQQQQMATMLQWQQMQMQQMQAAFAMQQQALASGQQMSFPGAAGMPFVNPYMAQFPMGGGMWPPQLNGQQLMMMQQQAQQQAMQQQALLAQQQAQQQQQQQQLQGQASQQLSQPQQQQQQLAQVPGAQAVLQPSLASAHSSGTDFMQQPLQQQPQHLQQPVQPLAPASSMQNNAMPMSGIVQGAVSSQRPASQGAGLTLSDAGMAHIKWEYGSSSVPMQGNGSDPSSAGRSDGAAVVPDLIAAGSASGSGQLNVPSMPASALLAGALMPPPHPVGGMPMTRAERVDRYREKKARRTDGGAVRYIARQQNAHRRPRIKGRFVKAGELAEYLAANPGVTVTHAGKLLGHGEDGDTESNAQMDAGDSTAVALSAPAQPAAAAHVVPSASNVSGGVDCPAPPAATA